MIVLYSNDGNNGLDGKKEFIGYDIDKWYDINLNFFNEINFVRWYTRIKLSYYEI